MALLPTREFLVGSALQAQRLFRAVEHALPVLKDPGAGCTHQSCFERIFSIYICTGTFAKSGNIANPLACRAHGFRFDHLSFVAHHRRSEKARNFLDLMRHSQMYEVIKLH